MLLVGCPFRAREWALESWFSNVEAACAPLGIIPGYIFACSPRDQPGVSMMEEWGKANARAVRRIWIEEDKLEDVRVWSYSRYERMTYIRNILLGAVREMRPLYYLSLDSDILLHPDFLLCAFDSMLRNNWDAVGGKCYMTPTGTECPSFGFEPGIRRYETKEVMDVDIVMACVLMNSRAFKVSYSPHNFGEDIGYSQNARANGLRLGFDGRVTSKHLMSRDMLNTIDPRCGY